MTDNRRPIEDYLPIEAISVVDEPLTGRAYDGENYNIGFLTVTDTP